MGSRSILWFRRDLRIGDNPALNAALEAADEIVPVYILEPELIKEMGAKRAAYLGDSLRALDKSLDGNLHVISGQPTKVLTELKNHYQVNSIHISAEYEPNGAARDVAIEAAGIELTRTGSPYAVAPGRVRKPSDDTPYKVYTPFYRAWLVHGWRKPALAPKRIPTVKVNAKYKEIPEWKWPADVTKSEAGEVAAIARFKVFKKSGLLKYDESRNFAAIDGTSKMSAHLSFGEIHPRTLLAELGESAFTLEVTSPGIDRPLTKPRHWRKNFDRLVKINMTSGKDIEGRIGEATEKTVLVGEQKVSFEDIKRAVLEIEFK